ncbi:hypothetical protein CE91St46_14550 [Eubacteriales bacterium]|nr:hypothetical protein CE91St46_14550 [Eubacteriales bacterium]GKH62981.1 hypothetical protein CE91St47_14500 [Eubacteriales bacterium]
MYNCGVREKTLLEELESLDLDQHDRDRIVKKYTDEENRNKEQAYNEVRALRREIEEKDNIIKGLAGYIGMLK